MKKGSKCELPADVLDRAVSALAGLLAELGACPPNNVDCPQRNKLVNISVCSTCLRGWAESKAKGD